MKKWEEEEKSINSDYSRILFSYYHRLFCIVKIKSICGLFLQWKEVRIDLYLSEDFIAMKLKSTCMKIQGFCFKKTVCSVPKDPHFKEIWGRCLHLIHSSWTILKTEETSSFEMSDTSYQSTRCHDPEYLNFINVFVRIASLVFRSHPVWRFGIQYRIFLREISNQQLKS